MSSIVPASFNVSVGSYLQSFLSQNTSVTASGGLLGTIQSNGSATTSSVFGLLQSSSSSGAGATVAALSTGGLKTNYQKIIATIGSQANGVLTQSWNSNGTEPSTLTTLRNYGWVKLTGKTYNSTTKTYSGNYILTPVGKGIYQRTGGGLAGSASGLSAAELGVTSGTTGGSTSSLTSAQSAQIVSILSSLGLVGASSSSSSVGGVPTSSSSTNTTGTVASIVA